MKNIKLLAMLLAVVMTVAVAFTVSAFDDVSTKDDCFDAVSTLSSLGVIKGKTESTFAPNDPVTREQMAALFTRLFTTISMENGENYTPFTDLDDPYYNSVIAWCYQNEVINGTTPTTFEPKAGIIYQDALTMACRLIGYTDLNYPLGYITRARLAGLTDDLDGVAFDKELTRGETAIILYNTLNAEGKEVIKENKVKYYSGYPILETVERNFVIATDVYNFKTETYQIVGTDNFNLAGFPKASTETSYVLQKIDDDDDTAYDLAVGFDEYEFEDIAVDEGTNSDDAFLGYLDIYYKGDSLDDKKAIVLSSAVVSDFANDAAVKVYFKKNTRTGKLEAQDDKISINGKAFDAWKKVYTMDNNGTVIQMDPADTLDVFAPVFYQTNENDEGAYRQLLYDVNKDGEVDYILFFPLRFAEITNVTTKGVYTIKDIDANKSTKYDTSDEDNNTLFFEEKAAKDDYVLLYEFGPFVYVNQVLKPVVTNVKAAASNKYTLGTGDVVKLADLDNPVAGDPLNVAKLSVSSDEIALYIVNGKVIYTTDADDLGYTPYTYAFIVSKADEETSVDMDDGTVEKVYNLVAFINGKAVTIPTYEDYAGRPDWDASFAQQVVTVEKIKDGKYILKAGLQRKDVDKEVQTGSGTIAYYSITKLYTITAGGKTYRCNLDANSEIYVRANNPATGEYDSVKRYTMANIPADLDGTAIEDAIVRKNDDGTYTLVVAYSEAGTEFAGSGDYTSYRIVLSAGLTMDSKNRTYATYDVLNPYSGAIETITDTSVEVDEIPTDVSEGALIKQKSNKVVQVVSGATSTASLSSSISGVTALMAVPEDGIVNKNVLTFYTDKTASAVFTNSSKAGSEAALTSAKVVVLTINDDDEFEVEIGDISDVDGKVVRMYTRAANDYRIDYIVVVPFEWAKDAGFADAALVNYDEA